MVKRRGRGCGGEIYEQYKRNDTFMNITIYDIAQKCGVSIATVSRVLNGSKPRQRKDPCPHSGSHEGHGVQAQSLCPRLGP